MTTTKPIHEGHKKRLREKAVNNLNALADHEILELLLGFGIARKDTNKLAHNLIAQFGSLQNVFDTDYQTLCNIDGVGEASACLLSIIPLLLSRFNSAKLAKFKRIDTLEDAVSIFRPILNSLGNEALYVMSLNDVNKVISCERIAVGSDTALKVFKGDAFRCILKHYPTRVILAHNHITGSAIPSSADLQFTKDVKNILDQFNIRLVEHIIIADEDFSLIINGTITEHGKEARSLPITFEQFCSNKETM